MLCAETSFNGSDIKSHKMLITGKVFDLQQ